MAKSRRGHSGNVVGVVVVALVAVLFTPTPAGATTGTTTRVSVAADGREPNGASWGGDLSGGQARYIAFSSTASDLVAGDTNGAADVFVRDRQTGTTSRRSVAGGGTQGNGGSGSASISGDGRYVAFASSASNLVDGDTNNVVDVFVHERGSGATTRVSVASDGAQGTGDSDYPSISADGRYVAFSTDAVNLLPGSHGSGIVVHDRVTRLTSAVGYGLGAEISADGLFVAFHSGIDCNAQIAGGIGGQCGGVFEPGRCLGECQKVTEVFVHDRITATTTVISRASDGTPGDDASAWPTLSGDGRFVAFQSSASNLVPGDTNFSTDIFVHDRQTGATTLVSDGHSPAISADGHHVAFSSTSPLVAGDTNGYVDAYVHDRRIGVNTRASVASDGTEGNLWSYASAVSDDGSHVSFGSYASTFVAGDTSVADVFLHSRGASPVVSVGDASVHEGDAGTRTATFTVSLSAPSPATVTVPFTTASGTTGDGDFTAKTGTLTFAAGTTSATVKVPVAGDTGDEADEGFTLALSSPTGAVLGDGAGVGTILDDDPPAVSGRRMAIGDVAVHEGDTGNRSAMFTVSLSKASTSPVSVSFATAKGTANGSDFTAKSGKLSFPAGTTSLSVDVPITPDTAGEGDESFSVKLSSASGATIVDATGSGTIVDND